MNIPHRFPALVTALATCFISAAAFTANSQTAPVATGTNDTASATNIWLSSRGVRVHDPSTIVKCKDEYWVFYTGNGVPSYHSKDLVTWEPGPRAITTTPT